MSLENKNRTPSSGGASCNRFNKYSGSNKPLVSICRKNQMGIELEIRYWQFELGNKTFGSTGADDFTVGQLY
jgi:hypothetical protein